MVPDQSRANMPSPIFDTQVMEFAPDEWMLHVVQDLGGVDGFSTTKFRIWRGNGKLIAYGLLHCCRPQRAEADLHLPLVYEAFDLEPEEEQRELLDYGLQIEGKTLPSVIIQSCLHIDYATMRREMRWWMSKGQGTVQIVILLTWTIITTDLQLPSLRLRLEVVQYNVQEQELCEVKRDEVRRSNAMGLRPEKLIA